MSKELTKAKQRKIDGYLALKREIDDDMAVSHDALERVRGKVRENTGSKNPNGLLSGK